MTKVLVKSYISPQLYDEINLYRDNDESISHFIRMCIRFYIDYIKDHNGHTERISA
jgi:hypothetical protein